MEFLNEVAEVILILFKLGSVLLFSLFLLALPLIGDAILAVLASMLIGFAIDNFDKYHSLRDLSIYLIFVVFVCFRFYVMKKWKML